MTTTTTTMEDAPPWPPAARRTRLFPALAARVLLLLLLLLATAVAAQETTAAGGETRETTSRTTTEESGAAAAVGPSTSTPATAPSTEAGGTRDVTATSQSILLLTEGRNHSETIGTGGPSTPVPDETRPTATPVSIRNPGTKPEDASSGRENVSTADGAGGNEAEPNNSTLRPADDVSGGGGYRPGNATVLPGNSTGGAGGPGGAEERRTVVLTFNGSCGEAEAASAAEQLDSLLGPKATGAADPGEAPACVVELRLRLSVRDPDRLRALVGSARVRSGGRPLVLARVEEDGGRPDGEDDDRERDYGPRIFGEPLSVRELATYAVVGAVFGLAVLAVSALLCCKCCGCRSAGRRKASRDVPRLALRLEDYSLTRIPRPSTLASDRRRGNGAAEGAGVRQAFDTSVVPLDDPPGRGGGPLRSFSGRRRRPPEAAAEAGSASPALYGSNERLARDFGPGRREDRGGADNQVFRF